MATATNHNHFPANQAAALQKEPSPTDLALVAAQVVRSNLGTARKGDDPYGKAAEAAYALWSACNTLLQSKKKPNGGATEQVRQVRRQQLKALGVTEPATYPVDLKQFLLLTACPGRTHPDRLTKYRAWQRGLGESDDISTFQTHHDFLAFAGLAARFAEWLKLQRREAARRARVSKKIENGH